MRPFTSTISLDAARAHLTSSVQPIQRTDRVPLALAAGRVAATDVSSPIAVPPFSRSAMDGYAVIARDTTRASRTAPVRLRVGERVFSGQTPVGGVDPGTCAEIATGAPLPEGADAVVMVEETASSGAGYVNIFDAAQPGQNIGPRGADISPGDSVVRAGDLLNPSRVGALAAIGCAELTVFARPRVAILSTGNEIVEPGAALGAGQIFDVNRFTLAAVVGAHGGIPEPHAPAGDTIDALEAALTACLDADILVFSGGSSVGDRDLIVDVVARRGSMIFHGIAVKPGKPTAFALIEGRPFFGMPGNPTSCLSNAYILLAPFVRATARLPVYAPRTLRALLARKIVSPVGRHQFYTVRLRDGAAYPAFKGSGEITSLSQADGYVEIPASQHTIEEGETVEVTLF